MPDEPRTTRPGGARKARRLSDFQSEDLTTFSAGVEKTAPRHRQSACYRFAVSRRATDLLCLSSGLTLRYRQDILRALALPLSSRVQFRYSDDIVDASLAPDLERDAISGSVALLAHVECDESSHPAEGPCFVTPCRRAVLISSKRVGKYFVLVFQLGGYAVAEDIDAFQLCLPEGRPRWREGSLGGQWCLRTTHTGWKQTFGLAGFQDVAIRLSDQADFVTQPFFLAVEGIFQRGRDASIEPSSDGDIVLPAGQHFALRLFHFAPKSDHSRSTEPTGQITVAAASPLEAVTSATLPIDSPYDLKSFAFRTIDRVAVAQSGALVIRAECLPGSAHVVCLQPELHLSVRIEPSLAKALGQTAVLTLLLFVQQFVTANSKEAVSAGTAVTLFVLALLTACFAVFALKKPL